MADSFKFLQHARKSVLIREPDKDKRNKRKGSNIGRRQLPRKYKISKREEVIIQVHTRKNHVK